METSDVLWRICVCLQVPVPPPRICSLTADRHLTDQFTWNRKLHNRLLRLKPPHTFLCEAVLISAEGTEKFPCQSPRPKTEPTGNTVEFHTRSGDESQSRTLQSERSSGLCKYHQPNPGQRLVSTQGCWPVSPATCEM